MTTSQTESLRDSDLHPGAVAVVPMHSVTCLTLDELVAETGPLPWDAGLELVQKLAVLLAKVDASELEELDLSEASRVLIDDDGEVHLAAPAVRRSLGLKPSADLSAILRYATGDEPAPTPEYHTLGRLLEERFREPAASSVYMGLAERIESHLQADDRGHGVDGRSVVAENGAGPQSRPAQSGLPTTIKWGAVIAVLGLAALAAVAFLQLN
ncbi:hypothetical protein [Stratiformator vulcanicus]|uniref:Uncharacterized protein n=1 Tax=Stratiformator vulcanicus TaxID=2527980 RepID=A0A517R5N4_9PLAN|nr:hypothetical protein [Stratiformator vulcanicus]QDT39145.1 hypothetical protein Pan189_35480 [Stratiformator vulcanicus]